MFFSISKQQNNDFPHHITWGDFCIDFDDGWTVEKDFIYKGYDGKSCLLTNKENTIEIDTGLRQTFPIFINEENFVISNILPGNFFIGKLVVTPEKILKLPAPAVKFRKIELTDDEIIEKVDKIITQSLLSLNIDQPFKLFITGGVDTILLAAYVVKNKIPYELVTCEHFDLDYFMCHNRYKLKNFWAYKSLHYWTNKTYLLSGANGDEMMLRNPYDAYLILKFFGEDLVSECQNNHHYHNSHFLKSKQLSEFEKLSSLSFENEVQLKEFILNRNAGDFQHWHLGNTYTVTPFDNLEITKLMLNLSNAKLRSQLLDAQVSKELITRNAPQLLKYLSTDKNKNNFKNLACLFTGIDTL